MIVIPDCGSQPTRPVRPIRPAGLAREDWLRASAARRLDCEAKQPEPFPPMDRQWSGNPAAVAQRSLNRSNLVRFIVLLTAVPLPHFTGQRSAYPQRIDDERTW